jgi:hypothetical protein
MTDTLIAPDFTDVAYGSHQRQVYDLWRSRKNTSAPLLIYIHGGGFMQGNKDAIQKIHIERWLENGFALASIHYRLTDAAPFPAQMHDAARALQHIRHHAADYGIDSTRIACAGGSAGSGISQWLGFHDDLADSDAEDPIARQSTRISAIGAINMQCTYDPRIIRKIVPGNAHQHVAMKRLFDVGDDFDWDSDAISDDVDARINACGPLSLLNDNIPPVFICNMVKNEQTGNIHHPNLARHLDAELTKRGLDHVFHLDSDFDSCENDLYDALREFMSERL